MFVESSNSIISAVYLLFCICNVDLLSHKMEDGGWEATEGRDVISLFVYKTMFKHRK